MPIQSMTHRIAMQGRRHSIRIPNTVGIIKFTICFHWKRSRHGGEWRRHANPCSVSWFRKHKTFGVKPAKSGDNFVLADAEITGNFR